MALRAPRGLADPAARGVAQRVLDTIRKPYVIEGRRVQIGCSLGGACWPDHAEPDEAETGGDGGIDGVMNKADAVLYTVKRTGKGRILLHGETVDVA
jgi:GGDEF domain-containing protein